ncbi:MAG: hypothetical protein ACT4P9_02425 [Betaproteobacteria bacterium]
MNALRGVLISYGVGAFLFFQSRALPPGWSLVMLGAGVGLQLALLVLGRILDKQAMSIAGLVADGVTVLLFALGTFKGIAGQVDAL